MMTEERMALIELVEKQADGDLMREMPAQVEGPDRAVMRAPTKGSVASGRDRPGQVQLPVIDAGHRVIL